MILVFSAGQWKLWLMSLWTTLQDALMDFLRFSWHFCPESPMFLKVFMDGSLGLHCVDLVYHAGCISKTLFNSLILLCGYLIAAYSTLFWFLWFCSGVSSFNHFIHELSVDSDTSSLDYSSGDDDSDGMSTPPSPLSQSSLRSWASLPANYESHWTDWITFIVWWALLPARILLWVPLYLLRLLARRNSRMQPLSPGRYQHSSRPCFSKAISGKEHDVPNRTTDKRRGVIEVSVDGHT